MDIDLNKKQHKLVTEIEAVKLWIFTIRKAYTITQFIECPAGEYCARDEMVKGMTRPNQFLKSLQGEG